jgi:transposase-like protein
MEKSMGKKRPEEVDYEQYVVRRSVEDYWRADEKAQLVVLGMSCKMPVTTLCKLNNVSASQYYEWRERFIARGKQGLMANGGRSQREAELEKKINVLERCIGELTLEKELLKKISSED